MYELRDAGLEGFEALYPQIKRDFPPHELPPKFAFVRSIKDGWADCLTFDQGEERAGYVLLLRSRKKSHNIGMVWFLAVMPGLRGGGVGTALLEALHRRYSQLNGLMVEVERAKDAKGEEERALRERRVRFYQRCGYQVLPRDIHLYGTPYHLMARGLADPDFAERAAREELALYRGFYGALAPLRLL